LALTELTAERPGCVSALLTTVSAGYERSSVRVFDASSCTRRPLRSASRSVTRWSHSGRARKHTSWRWRRRSHGSATPRRPHNPGLRRPLLARHPRAPRASVRGARTAVALSTLGTRHYSVGHRVHGVGIQGCSRVRRPRLLRLGEDLRFERGIQAIGGPLRG